MGETPLQMATRLRDEAARGGLRKMREISIVIGAARDFPQERNFGATTEDGLEIILAPKLTKQSQDVIQGVVAHELGHAADFLYPSMWEFAFGRWHRYKQRYQYNYWVRRDYDQVERAADGIAETMFGTKIYYAGYCLMQSTARGLRPRPLGLR